MILDDGCMYLQTLTHASYSCYTPACNACLHILLLNPILLNFNWWFIRLFALVVIDRQHFYPEEWHKRCCCCSMLASSILLSSFTKFKLRKQKQLVSHFGDSSIKLLSRGHKTITTTVQHCNWDKKRKTHVCKRVFLYLCAYFGVDCVSMNLYCINQ